MSHLIGWAVFPSFLCTKIKPKGTNFRHFHAGVMQVGRIELWARVWFVVASANAAIALWGTPKQTYQDHLFRGGSPSVCYQRALVPVGSWYEHSCAVSVVHCWSERVFSLHGVKHHIVHQTLPLLDYLCLICGPDDWCIISKRSVCWCNLNNVTYIMWQLLV